MNKELLIIAGEASGDLHGASLIRELKSIDPSVKFIGIGGNKMRSQGMELLFHINQMAFLGFAEVLRHIPFIKKVQNLIIREVINRRIDTVVLIDYPGFNLNIAKKLKNLDVKVIYYISPQIWAWGHGRIKKIKKLVDKMMVILPFEEEFFRNAGVNVEYVGHPLLEQIENYNYLSRDDFFRKFSLDIEREILLLLPGSRLQEVKRIFPESIKAACRLAEDLKMQLVVACSSDIDEQMFFQMTDKRNFKVIKEHTYDLYKYASFGIIKSGTSTLEAALFGLPMILVYATNQLTYLIGKSVIKIDKIGLVNIVAGNKIVDELIQDDVNENMIYETSMAILSDPGKLESKRNELRSIHARLGQKGASKRCALLVYEILTRK
ncbi:MAG: lipid-A-disaccharide synthase [Clostridiales bacterium]